jgi:lipopolysaccharide transport protein LptA
MFKQIKYRPMKVNQVRGYPVAIILLALVNPLVSWPAMAIDNEDEILIEADYMKFDLESGSSTYKGNVSIIQDTIKLTGENVVITRKDNEIQDIKVDGNPAHYLQDESTDNKVHAIAQHMKYTAHTNRLVLTVDASLEQSDQTVESQRIVYDTQNKVIIAGKKDSPDQSGDRVNIILTPKKDVSPKTDGQGE